MNSIRKITGIALYCLALPAAFAASSPITYNFTEGSLAKGISSTNAVTTGAASPFTDDNAGFGATGTNYGNSLVFNAASGSSQVTVNAFATTGNSSAGSVAAWTIQNAFVSQYSNYGTTTASLNELAVSSRVGNTANGNTEFQSTSSGPMTPDTSNNQHAMDNAGAYEMLDFAFQSKVTLNSISIGYPPSSSTTLGSDATVLYYKGTGNPTTNLAGGTRTLQDLVNSGDWGIAGNLYDLAATGGTASLSTSASSQYWMVGALINSNAGSAFSASTGPSVGTNDYIKLTGLGVTAVPEPSSIALVGLASLGLLVRRRRKTATV